MQAFVDRIGGVFGNMLHHHAFGKMQVIWVFVKEDWGPNPSPLTLSPNTQIGPSSHSVGVTMLW